MVIKEIATIHEQLTHWKTGRVINFAPIMASEQKIRVRFFTRYDNYRITDAPFAVPSKLGRYGLSEVVNHLLDTAESPQPFDFAINGRLVRISLKKFVVANRISTEDVVLIEYMPAVNISDESDSVKVPAWVGCLETLDGLIVAGCYDGKIQIVDKSFEVNATTEAHKEPIRSITCWNSKQQQFIATASKDQSIKCWSLNSSTTKNKDKIDHSLDLAANLVGHINSVECIDYWNAQRILLSGDWSGNIFGWSMKGIEDKDNNENEVISKKKQKSDKGSITTSSFIKEIKPTFTLRGHAQSVSGIQVCGDNESSKVYTCSWDHSLKEWDIERQDCVATYASSKVMTSLHYSESANLVATSHPDGRIRLWDSRKRDEAQSMGSFTSGKDNNWVAQVKWHPTSPNIFASADYDGVVKVWDTRAVVPLGSTEAHTGKVLCVDWLQGGKDGEKVDFTYSLTSNNPNAENTHIS